MNGLSDVQIEESLRKVLAGRADAIRPATAVQSSQGRHKRWLPLLLAAVVVAVTTLVAGLHVWGGHEPAVAPATKTLPKASYIVYRGHRWLLDASQPSSGYIALNSDGKVTFWNTEQQLIGTYSIKDDGQLITHWTGVSSGMVNFDQTVVDRLSQFSNGAPAFIRSTDPATLVLDVGGRRLIFSKE